MPYYFDPPAGTYTTWVNQIDAFTQAELKEIQLEAFLAQPSPGLVNQGEYKPEVREAIVRYIDVSPANERIYKKISGILMGVNAMNWEFDLSGIIEPMQYVEYSEKGHYSWHIDLGRGPSNTRKLGFSLLVEAAEEGGELEFQGHSRVPKVIAGDMIVFPSFVPHRVTPVVKGMRKALVGWVSGKPFR